MAPTTRPPTRPAARRRNRAVGACAALLALPLATRASAEPPPGPDPAVRITEAYARVVARDAYFWAWPLVNMHNRRVAIGRVRETVMAGPLPRAPLNRLAMLTDYIDPAQRNVASPNQDVIYGGGLLALDLSPVILQAPDFGDRFWMVQGVDERTDSFIRLGRPYGSKPGFYLLVGPDWRGEPPPGVRQVFRASTHTGLVGPRVFVDGEADRRALQPLLNQLMMYPLAEFDGTVKRTDWAALPRVPGPPAGDEEIQWVSPDRFFDDLPAALADAPPLPGEAARYAQVLAVVDAAARDPVLKAALADEARATEAEVVKPLFQFRSLGQPLPFHWTTIGNGGAFGTDYFTRTAVAKSNILVNTALETKYFYQDLDDGGLRLSGDRRYAITFAKGMLPPVRGFWSLTLYNPHHFFAPNALGRYSVGTKSQGLKRAPDGSLTIYVQAEPPPPAERANWLPAPRNAELSLMLRAYWPEETLVEGRWTPPAVRRLD